MNRQYFENLDETLLTARLPNGLTVHVVPKPGFSRKVAYFATDFGSVHREFTLEGQEYQVPAGVAHFLEHKLFELPDRDVNAEFAALGANVNAFTSFDLTAYYFSCTENFQESLALLLEFVSTPWFPADSVAREMGIIDQEIAMHEDDPDTQEFEALMRSMYQTHPVRVPILGTRESIRQITPEILHLCHRAFYTPANMVLTVVGDVDGEEIVAIAENILGTEYRAPGEKRRNWPESMSVGPDVQLRQAVAGPTFQIGFKCEPSDRGADAARLDALGYLAAEMLLGESTQLFLQMYEEGIIDPSFGGGFETIDGCAMLTCGGDSDRPEEVRQRLLDRAKEITAQGLDREEFRRVKRGAMGRRIRDLDSFDGLCYRICAYHFLQFEYLHFSQVYADITEEDVRDFLCRVITPERCSMAHTQPA